MEELRPLEEFPEYGVSKEGHIYNLKSGRCRAPSMTRSGAIKITLFVEGVGYTRSLPRLVAQAWVYNDFDPDVFDTPIHLDNDLANNHADNLAWRPRWFAVKYQQQYWNEEYRFNRTAVENVRTGEEYRSIMEVCQAYGVLFMDVLESCLKGREVFPTWKQFRFAS